MLHDNYIIDVYNDFYIHGICDWKIKYIYLDIVSKDNNLTSYHPSFTLSEEIKVSKPINLICDKEYIASTDFIRHYCKDPIQNLDDLKAIKIADSQNEFEINFKQIAEPAKTLNKGN